MQNAHLLCPLLVIVDLPSKTIYYCTCLCVLLLISHKSLEKEHEPLGPCTPSQFPACMQVICILEHAWYALSPVMSCTSVRTCWSR